MLARATQNLASQFNDTVSSGEFDEDGNNQIDFKEFLNMMYVLELSPSEEVGRRRMLESNAQHETPCYVCLVDTKHACYFFPLYTCLQGKAHVKGSTGSTSAFQKEQIEEFRVHNTLNTTLEWATL
jgi:hypothetical protein